MTSAAIQTIQLPIHLRFNMICAARLIAVVRASQPATVEFVWFTRSHCRNQVPAAMPAITRGQASLGVWRTCSWVRSSPPRSHQYQPRRPRAT